MLPRNKSVGETLLNSHSIIMYSSLSFSEEFPRNMTVCFPDWLQQLQPTPQQLRASWLLQAGQTSFALHLWLRDKCISHGGTGGKREGCLLVGYVVLGTC